MAEEKNMVEGNTEEAQSVRRLRLPKKEQNEMFAIVSKLLGANKILAICQDAKERNCRIPGRMKKRIWLREGDLIIIKVWDFQPSKADVVWRYSNTQKHYLANRGYLEGLPV